MLAERSSRIFFDVRALDESDTSKCRSEASQADGGTPLGKAR